MYDCVVIQLSAIICLKVKNIAKAYKINLNAIEAVCILWVLF